MEFKEVVGRRRSIRYFVPYRPVEREKIQTIMEAARLASCAVNASFLRAVVVERDQLSADDLQALKVPTTTLQLDMRPSTSTSTATSTPFRKATATPCANSSTSGRSTPPTAGATNSSRKRSGRRFSIPSPEIRTSTPSRCPSTAGSP